MEPTEIKPAIHFSSVIDVLNNNPQEGLTGNLAFVSTFLLSRGTHLGLNGDKVVISDQTNPDVIEYMQNVTGQSPEYIMVPTTTPLRSTDLLDAMHTQIGALNGHQINPYHQSTEIARWAIANGYEMTQTDAQTAIRVMPIIDNKAYFRETARQLGMPMMEQRSVKLNSEDFVNESISHIGELIRENGGVYIQSSNSGGGLGNVDVIYHPETQTYTSESLGNATYTDFEDMAVAIEQWVKEAKHLGSTDILIAPYIGEMIESPTVTAYIPPLGQGDPVIYGYFDQIVDPKTRAYQGFMWPIVKTKSGVDPKYLYDESMKWFKHIQAMGYFGNADADYAIGKVKPTDPDEDIIITGSESNVRQNAYRIPLQHAYKIAGGIIDPRNIMDIAKLGVPNIHAFDHVHTRANNMTELIAALKIAGVPLLGQNQAAGFNPEAGIVAIAAPLGREVALAAVGPGAEYTQKLIAAAMKAVA